MLTALPCRTAACHLSCLTFPSKPQGIAQARTLSWSLRPDDVRVRRPRRRGTFYGGPESFLSHFSDRGPAPEYGFGTTLFGSCGFYQQVRTPRGMVHR